MDNTKNKFENSKSAFLSEFSMFYQMHRISRAIFRKANRIMQDSMLPLQMEQTPVLMVVYLAGSISQQEIAEDLHRDKSSIQRTVVALQKKGLMRIEQDSNDKRRNIITLTEEGKRCGDTIRTNTGKIENAVIAHLSAVEQKKVIKMLGELADKLEGV